MKPNVCDQASGQLANLGPDRATHCIPADLNRALAFLDPISKIGRRLLIYVIDWSYPGGDMLREDPRPATINNSVLARKWGVSQQYVSAQLSGLVADKVLLKLPGQDGPRYLLNLEFQDWVGSRIEPQDLDDILNGLPQSRRVDIRLSDRTGDDS